MDKEFLKWYRKKYERIEGTPPDEVWERISFSLNAERTRKKKRQIIYITTIFVFLSSVFVIGGRIISDDLFGAPFSARVSRDHDLMFNSEAKHYSNKPHEEYHGTKSNEIPHTRNSVGADMRSVVSPEHANVRSKNRKMSNSLMMSGDTNSLRARFYEEALNEDASQNIPIINVSSVTDALPEPLDIQSAICVQEADSIRKVKKKHSVYCGVLVNYNNSWLVNANLWDASHPNSLSYVIPFYSLSMSALGGYSLNEKTTLFAELGKRSLGQKYYTYQEGHVKNSNLLLNYIHLNLYASLNSKRKQIGINVRSWLSLQVGAHGGYLLTARQDQNGANSQNVSNQYRKLDAGAFLGMAYSVQYKRVVISGGARGNFGLINTYKGAEDVPFSLNKTFNQNFSLFLSASYAF